MKAYIKYVWNHEGDPCGLYEVEEISFQPFEGVTFKPSTGNSLRYQREVEISGDLYVATKTDPDGLTTILGVTSEKEEAVEVGDYIFISEKVESIVWKELFDPRIAEKKRLELQIAELQAQLKAL
jgi:hypothetical protein